jgi:PIN domain nuclease of toxin-antitoxin system
MYVDTNVVLFLAMGALERIPGRLRVALPRLPLLVSPMVALELQYLHEIGRLARPGLEVLDGVRLRLDMRVSEMPLTRVAAKASSLSWTRDPFDRLITAQAMADDLPLLTSDRRILANSPLAVWEGWGA